jgi:hypothetical protein
MCTLVGQALGGDVPFLASTSDDPYSTGNYVMAGMAPSGARYLAVVVHSIGGSVQWDGMISRGVNDSGFAFTYSFVAPARVPKCRRTGGMSPTEFSYRLLTECRDTNQALTFLERGVPEGVTGNYLLLDAEGRLAVAEAAQDATYCRWVQSVVRTNAWTVPPMPAEQPSVYGGESSAFRANRASHLLRDVRSSHAVGALLRDHIGRGQGSATYGQSICNHGSNEGTISAEILVPRHRVLRYAYGRPCGESDVLSSWGSYRSFTLGTVPDGHLTDLTGALLKPVGSVHQGTGPSKQDLDPRGERQGPAAD